MPELPKTLLLLDEPFTRVEATYYCPRTWWRFVRVFASHCDSITLYVPLREAKHAPSQDRVELDGIRIVGRPYYDRLYQYFLKLPFCHRILHRQARALVREHDLLICRVPAPVAGYVASAAKNAGKALALLVAGNIETSSALVAGKRGPSAWLGCRLARWLLRRDLDLARHTVFVGAWGDEVFDLFKPHAPRVQICQSPNIRERDLIARDDTCMGDSIRLLRVCRLLPTKGIEMLLEAVATLRAEGRPIRLDVAGAGDTERYVKSLHHSIQRLDLADHVVLHGTVPFGPKLFDLYRQADIHVVSSLGEGTPRCIAEGRAFGLPTVATAVGGIPTVVMDGIDGLLVSPADSSALTRGIRRIIDDAALRKRIVRGGSEIAQQSTAEYHAARLARLLAEAMSARLTSEHR